MPVYRENQTKATQVVSGPEGQPIGVPVGQVVEGPHFLRDANLTTITNISGKTIVYRESDRETSPVLVASGSTDVVALDPATLARGARLLGYCVSETAGSAATVAVYRGTDISGDLLIEEKLAANTSKTMWFNQFGPVCTQGLFVDRTGSTKIIFYVRGL